VSQYMALMFRDDITGTDGDYSVRFGLDDQWYQIELAEPSRNDLRHFLETRFIPYATKVSTGLAEIPARAPADVIHQQQLDERIIQWALETGLRKKRPGRVSAQLRKMYQQEHAIS
jgi:hypothetical protein